MSLIGSRRSNISKLKLFLRVPGFAHSSRDPSAPVRRPSPEVSEILRFCALVGCLSVCFESAVGAQLGKFWCTCEVAQPESFF